MRGATRSPVLARVQRTLVTAAAALTGLAAVAGLAACGDDTDGSNGALGRDVRFYVNPSSTAARAVSDLRQQGEDDKARRLEDRIAGRPAAVWLTPVADAVFNQARSVTAKAAERGVMPVLVAYDLPDRDCGQYSAGGASDIDAYLQWLGSLAAGVGDRRAVVILEPDAIAHTLQGCAGSQSAAERYRMLREAVKILQRQPNVSVYLDAGNASWVKDLGALAGALKASGIGRADGFVLNVSNFETTARSTAYGRRLSQRTGGAHFVVDTSRNGAGPPVRSRVAGKAWCNPQGVRLGTSATTRTGARLVDAYLWIKQPGDSDGSCGRGAPAAGRWWPTYAGELMARTPAS